MSSLCANSSVQVRHLSKFCRFCKKILLLVLGRKSQEFLYLTSSETRNWFPSLAMNIFVLADIVSSLGFDLVRSDKLSDVSCLTCARTLAKKLKN